ncbi:5589_t:CDS:2 [Funneliformis geosporum]|nr:5589_t:CDS:2 [Funneliformis geosporum]
MTKILSDALLRDISNLYDGTDDYDVKIEVGQEVETEIFKAHSVILRARSSYFRAAFSSNWAMKEGDFLILKKPNMSPLVFQSILKNNFNSSIFTARQFCLISYWINGQEPLLTDLKSIDYEFKLLLRGSKDGFKPEDFLSRCSNKGATIVIIKLKNSEKIIGGYNPITWSRTGTFLKTDKSFIFSLDKSLKSIILSRVKDSGYAISDDALNKIGFGKGDLYIFLNRCDLQDYTVKILDSKSFEIVDYEVFQVLTK